MKKVEFIREELQEELQEKIQFTPDKEDMRMAKKLMTYKRYVKKGTTEFTDAVYDAIRRWRRKNRGAKIVLIVNKANIYRNTLHVEGSIDIMAPEGYKDEFRENVPNLIKPIRMLKKRYKIGKIQVNPGRDREDLYAVKGVKSDKEIGNVVFEFHVAGESKKALKRFYKKSKFFKGKMYDKKKKKWLKDVTEDSDVE